MAKLRQLTWREYFQLRFLIFLHPGRKNQLITASRFMRFVEAAREEDQQKRGSSEPVRIGELIAQIMPSLEVEELDSIPLTLQRND